MRLFLIGILFLATSACMAQGLGAGTAAPAVQPPQQGGDTNMIFQSPKSLISPAGALITHHAWGLDILFSNDGFGGGVFYRNYFSRDVTGFADIEFSGVKNSNENDMYIYDYNTGTYISISGKLNDIYMIPITVGVQYRVFSDVISESFRPYINAAVGPAILIAAPDALSFFSGFEHAQFVVVPEFYVGIGANFGKDPHSVQGVNFRYYYIHYGPGIYSLGTDPAITQFGGFFITINWGIGY